MSLSISFFSPRASNPHRGIINMQLEQPTLPACASFSPFPFICVYTSLQFLTFAEQHCASLSFFRVCKHPGRISACQSEIVSPEAGMNESPFRQW
jgi:hypothetical protein